MKLQVTLDTYSSEDGITLLRSIVDSIDVIEVGTPLLLEEGMGAIDRVKQAFPQVDVMADTKIWHNGARIAHTAFAHGAHMVTVLAGATDEEVASVVDVARDCGGEVMADLSGSSGVIQRAEELEDLGVRYIQIPSRLRVYEDDSVDRDAFHRNTRAVGGMPLALVRNVRRSLRGKAEVAVVDNITLDNLDAVLKTKPGILLVGRAILAASDPGEAAAAFRDRMLACED